MAGLSIAAMQLVEIARAVSYDADIILMGEPTSALTDKEIELLYKIIRDLAARGVSVIVISHCAWMDDPDGNYIEFMELTETSIHRHFKDND